MKEWEYNFDPVSKAEWINQITSDLKQKPIEPLAGEWWEGEPREAVLHASDNDGEIVRLPDHLFGQAPLITEAISVTQGDVFEINHSILNALQQGVQSIHFHIPSAQVPFKDAWIENVNLDWISFQIEPNEFVAGTLNSVVENIPKQTILRLVRATSAYPITAILSQMDSFNKEGINSIRFVYEFGSTGMWIKKASLTFNALLSDLHEWIQHGYDPSVFLDQCILSLDADQDYFKQLIQTRVLHIIRMNLGHFYAKETRENKMHYLETHIRQREDEEPELFLISASKAALAASLTGTTALCIHPARKENMTSFFRRNIRNIHHLLELESGMYKGSDPLAGAVSIDLPTKRWSSQIWDNLLLEK